MKKAIKAKMIVPGKACGKALITRERYSFQGFIDPYKGIFHAPQSELFGKSFVGKILIFISGKGSSAGAAALDLACRNKNTPAAVVNLELDTFMVASCALHSIPMVQVFDNAIFDEVKNGDEIIVDSNNEKLFIH